MTNNKQQTAVEWFGMEMGKLFAQYHRKIICIGEFHQKRFELEQQAKEMEKIEKQNYLKEYFEWHKSMGFVSHKPIDIIEFNETYGGNK